MANAAVTAEAISKSVQLCQRSIQSLSSASQKLQQKYAAAGSGWKDSKYAQLGNIITECQNALKQPIEQLNGSIASLQDLSAAVSEYESTNL
jgi:prefoldin subunit 5